MRKISNKNGVTMVEIMVVMVILGFIFWGILRITNLMVRNWWKTTSSLTLQEEARQAMYYLVQDLKSAKASSIGNMGPWTNTSGLNSGFEEPYGGNVVPSGWDSIPPTWPTFPPAISRSTDNSRSGVYSLCLNTTLTAANIFYFSDVFTINAGPRIANATDYFLAGWINSNSPAQIALVDSASPFADPGATRRIDTAGTGWTWQYFSLTTPVLNNGLNYRIRIGSLCAGLPSPTSAYFDDVSLCPTNVIFSFATTSMNLERSRYYEYETSSSGAAGASYWWYRLDYSTGTEIGGRLIEPPSIYRDRFNFIAIPPRWDRVEPIPLCKYVKEFNIHKRINPLNRQEFFEIHLLLEKEEQAGQFRQYRLKETITPATP